jgi:hypothetical protein
MRETADLDHCYVAARSLNVCCVIACDTSDGDIVFLHVPYHITQNLGQASRSKATILSVEVRHASDEDWGEGGRVNANENVSVHHRAAIECQSGHKTSARQEAALQLRRRLAEHCIAHCSSINLQRDGRVPLNSVEKLLHFWCWQPLRGRRTV